MSKKGKNTWLMLVIFLFAFKPCYSTFPIPIKNSVFNYTKNVFNKDSLPIQISVNKNVTIEKYFQYMDSLVNTYNAFVPYKLTEHLLVRANPWIIDTLKNTDYYLMKERDSFVYDQKKMIALPKGASITIPDAVLAKKTLHSFQKTTIDINIPELKLRIYENSKVLYEFPIRVGRNEKKYLEMSRRIEDLRTKTGVGNIVKHIRNPQYINPVNNHEYFVTKRDDEKVTKLPQIPFIETEINGRRNGQLIHPTTNPITLGKAYSNGCIGTKETDAWIIYYYAPINTRISIRYNLEISDKDGGKIILDDIYEFNKNQ